jgi:hypothetical protein
MDDQIDFIYGIVDDILKAMNHQEDKQQIMSDAEVITTAIAAMLEFGGNFERARRWLYPKYISHQLSRSRFNRRLHNVKELLQTIFVCLAQSFKQINSESIYLIDSFPLAVCDNIRIPRCKIYQTEDYRGYKSSKKRYFYGLKIHLMVTASGEPVEFFLTPGASADVEALDGYSFDLPEGSTVYADKAYNDYQCEDLLREADEINLLPIRKSNSKRPVPAFVAYVQSCARKMIETAGSLIERLLPKSIHAVTAKGFELKAALFVIAFSFSCAF